VRTWTDYTFFGELRPSLLDCHFALDPLTLPNYHHRRAGATERQRGSDSCEGRANAVSEEAGEV